MSIFADRVDKPFINKFITITIKSKFYAKKTFLLSFHLYDD